MKLFGYWRSSATWRVRIALHYKQLPFGIVPVHLLRGGGEQHSEAFRALNPMQHVPVLELEHAGTMRHVSESLAIIELLDELYPTPALLPQDPLERARARQLALLVASGIQPLLNTKIQAHLKHQLHVDEMAWTRHWLASGLAALEASLAAQPGRFAVGDGVSVADLCLVPQVFGARRFGVPLEAYPNVLRVERECRDLAAFQKALPEHQPDFEPDKGTGAPK
ncbi:MAG: maleylacetoacetate isomerase [Myxococcales bacterium]